MGRASPRCLKDSLNQLETALSSAPPNIDRALDELKLLRISLGFSDAATLPPSPDGKTSQLDQAIVLSRMLSHEQFCANGAPALFDQFLENLKRLGQTGEFGIGDIKKLARDVGILLPQHSSISWLTDALKTLGLLEVTYSRGSSTLYRVPAH